MLRKLSIVAAVLLLVSCTAERLEDQTVLNSLPEPEQNLEHYVPGVVVLEFDDATADMINEAIGGDSAEGLAMTKAFNMTRSSAAEEILASLGAKSISRIFPYAGKWEARHREAGLHRFYRITFDETTPVTKAAGSLGTINGVINAEMKPLIKPMASKIPFNDPYNHLQWNLYNDGTLLRGFRAGIDINVIPVWEEFTAGSNDVVVAVVDGGVSMVHEDMLDVVIPSTEDGGSRSFVYDFEGPVTEGDAHGTHVAGIIAAVNNNGVGISSVAGGSDGKGGVKILSCQNLKERNDGSGGTYQGNSAAAVVWGADQGAVISQNSWGYSSAATGIGADDKAAIDYFIEYAGYDENGNQVGPMAGGIVLFAAGNDSNPHGWPAQYEPVVAVGALGPDGRKATYSNYGDWVDICAPGGEGDRFSNNNAMIVSPTYDMYYYMAGTSQACPHVSGVAALLLSHFGGQGFTNADLLDKLLYGADYTNIFESDQIGPKLNAYASFTIGEIADPDVVSDHSGDVVLKSHESLTVKYTVRNKGDMNLSFTFEGGSAAATGSASEDSYTVSFNALAVEPGDYKATLSASFGPGHTTVIEIPYTVLKNHAPKAVGAIPSVIAEAKDAIEVDLSKYFTDEDGEQLTFTADITTQRIVNVSFSGNTMTLRPSSFGSTPVTLTATDARGKSVTISAFTFLYYDISKGVSAYPNPVVDYLKVCAGKEKDMKIVLSNSNGVVLYEETVKGSALSPAQIDMKSFAPGRYDLTVTYDEVTSSKTIVKAL